ncbi:MAG: hypothetical protein H8M99_01125 [Gloeobacteraceae cyanobacterium ES-bin-144]|nr:hypothetical protein [Verrucomicrobiales bacterium]
MIRSSKFLFGGIIVLALTACVGPAEKPSSNTPAPKTVVSKPAPKKPHGKISSITLEDFFVLQQSDNALIYDARPVLYYRFGHIPGAINLPKQNCDALIAEWEPKINAAISSGKTLVVYCTNPTCPDAKSVAIRLANAGYPVKVISGGWEAWKESGMPIE